MDVAREHLAVAGLEARALDDDVLAQSRGQLGPLLLERVDRLGPAALDRLEHALAELLELFVVRHRLGLAPNRHDRADAVADAIADETLRRRAVGALRRLGHALLAQKRDRGVDVTAGLLQRALALHHPCAGRLAELLHQRCWNLHGAH